MIAVDTNILVHAHRRDSTHHRAAARCMTMLCESPDAWSIPWPCVHEFLSVVTNRKVFSSPTSLARAIDQVDAWLCSPAVTLLHETHRHWSVLVDLLREGAVAGGSIHDGRIAAICVENGVRELWTADRDFAKFPRLATFNPLEGGRVHDQRPSYAAAVRARAAGRRRSAERSASR